MRSVPGLIEAVKSCLGTVPDLTALPPETVRHLKSLMDDTSISFPSIGIQFPDNPDRVLYLDLFHCDLFDLGIFIMPEGTSIPAHDHPNMVVLTRVVCGKVVVSANDWDERSPKVSGSGLMYGSCLRHDDQVLTCSSLTSYLGPKIHNIHSIKSVEDAAFLDLIIPPYGDDRPCSYFTQDGSELNQSSEPPDTIIVPYRLDTIDLQKKSPPS